MMLHRFSREDAEYCANMATENGKYVSVERAAEEGYKLGLRRSQDALEASQEECRALRDQLGKLRDIGWKGIAEAPYPYRGVKRTLTGLIARISEILEGCADARDELSDSADYAYALRELHRNLHEMWERRGEPTIVAEFGALWCLDSELPAQEPDEEGEE